MKSLLRLVACSNVIMAPVVADEKLRARDLRSERYGKLAGLSQVQKLGEITAWQGNATDRLNSQGPTVSWTFGNSLH